MWLATFLLPVLTLFNLWVSTYVAHAIWIADLPLLSPILPYLFIAGFLGSWALAVSATGGYWRGIEFVWTSFVVYSAAMPAIAWTFSKAFFIAPTFERTPKGGERAQVHWGITLLTMANGAGLLLLSLWWRSPFSLVVASFGASQLAFPLVLRLHESKSAFGWVLRIVIFLPASIFIIGLLAMWLVAS